MRVRALGGATGHWEGWCRPLMPQDFETRDYIPNSGWPIRYADLLPWYARACETLEIGPFQWDAEARAKAMGTAVLPTGAAIDHRYYQFSPPTRFARVYGGALEKAENIRVIAHANVADIRLDETRGRVESFTCRTLAKTEFHVHANRYVLALGGIENPRVLLAARSQQPEGVANAYDVVGRYFMEHPHYYGSVGIVHLPELDRRFYATDAVGSEAREWHAGARHGRVRPRRQTSHAVRRLLNFSAAFHPVKEDGRNGCPAIGNDAGASDARRWRVPSCAARDSRRAVTARGKPRVADRRRRPAGNAASRARLADRAGRRRPVAPRARASRRASWERRELRAPGYPAIRRGSCWRPSPGGHHLGTTRMGTDPATSVVDADCRTHQVENLYIAGSSVFPTGGEANPTLTIVALAHRLADTLKKTA